jgi:hypothetical protein
MSPGFLVFPLLAAAPAFAQTATLYAVRTNGDLLRLNTATGAATLVGSSGVACSTGSPINYDCFGSDGRGPPICGSIADEFLLAGLPAQPNQVVYLNRWTGVVFTQATIPGLPAGYTVRAAGADWKYFIFASPDPGAIELLATVSDGGSFTLTGSTGQTDITSLATIGGSLYALASGGGGRLYSISSSTGAATLISAGGFGGDTGALGAMPDGTLYAAGANLRRVDPLTGATTLIGPTGFGDICGLGGCVRSISCYAACAGIGPPPLLNVTDFTCFLQKFALGSPYANCDESTTPPVLNVADFTCFMQKFSSACSAP